MAARKKVAKKGASRGPKNNTRARERGRDYGRGNRGNDRGRDYDDRNDDRGRGSDRRGGDREERTRLTGMWPSKKNRNMWTGRAKGEDLKKILDKMMDAEKGTGIVAFFMFENTRKRGPKDPDFTIYVDEGQEMQGGGGYRGRDDRDDRDNDRGRGSYRDDRF